MTDILILAAPMLLLASLYCLWRAVMLFRTWNPAAAIVWKSGYSELEREDDFWHFGATLGTIRGLNWRDGKNARWIEDEVQFTDAAGERRRAVVARRVSRGWRPDGVFTIWYDPAAPGCVTAFGPGHWVMLAAVWAACLAFVFMAGMQLAAKSADASPPVERTR